MSQYILKATQQVKLLCCVCPEALDLLAILQKSLDRAVFFYIFISEVRLNGVKADLHFISFGHRRARLRSAHAL